MNSDIVLFYKKRAREYEKIYSKLKRQSNLLLAGQILENTFADKDVFENACGTSYRTEKISVTAKKVLATDINNTKIEKSKKYSPAKVDFQTADIFNLANINKH